VLLVDFKIPFHFQFPHSSLQSAGHAAPKETEKSNNKQLQLRHLFNWITTTLQLLLQLVFIPTHSSRPIIFQHLGNCQVSFESIGKLALYLNYRHRKMRLDYKMTTHFGVRIHKPLQSPG
jgi:hypothetical protein